nr:ankyrin repeat and SOCS box protein 9-like [Gorilla gorilla gorilla]
MEFGLSEQLKWSAELARLGEGSMDGKQGSMDGSKPTGPRDSPDTRLLSNPLMGDSVSDWSPMPEAAIYRHQLSLRNLISHGWLVNIIMADHVSPLHEACLRGHPSRVKILLKHGAQVNGVTTDWHTPLLMFVSAAAGIMLLQHGASVQPESDLASPVHEAARRGHVECVDSLTAYRGNNDHNISHLGTSLYLACENQQIACVKKLLESGADVNPGRGSPLHAVAFMKAFMKDSPLHAVARTASEELACLLMDFGADTQAKNAEGKCHVELVPPESPLIQLFLEREGPPSLMQLCLEFRSALESSSIIR